MEDAGRSQPGLGLRRLRNLCADHLGRRRLAPASRPGELLPDPALCGHGDRAHPARLGDRRHDRGRGCRLYRAQARDDAGDPRLLDPDRAQRVCLGLAVLRGVAVFRGACDRVRMGDRHLDRFRTLARQESRQRSRADAMRLRHRFLPRLARVALHQPNRSRCLARHVPARRCAGAADAVDRRAIPESDQWGRVNERRGGATERKRSGAALSGQEESLARFTMLDLFAEPEIRARVILTFLMSLASTFAFWGISAWMPPYTASVAAKAGLPAQQWVSYVAMASNGAAIIGYAGFGFLADVFGRKPVTMAYFALAFLSVPVFFIWTHDLTLLLLAGAFSGIFVSGQFTWMSAWLPELFPTRVRATATAFVFNAPRLISWTGPLISGWLIANFGGFSQAAVVIAMVYILGLVAIFLPETRGKPLPE